MRFVLILALLSAPALADTVLATRTLRAGTLIAEGDVVVHPAASVVGGIADPRDAIGREARVTLYAGRPIRAANLSEPAAIQRNDLVTVVFRRGGLEIRTEGRALGRAAPGDEVRVMNTASRTTIAATVIGPGLVSAP
ncbi:MAG: flagellar basal body P-ring formation chaperone FlgA [Paracoccaceae bacterium]